MIEGSEVDATILKRLLHVRYLYLLQNFGNYTLYTCLMQGINHCSIRVIWLLKGSFFSAAIAAAQLEGYFPIFGKKTNLPAQWMNESHALSK